MPGVPARISACPWAREPGLDEPVGPGDLLVEDLDLPCERPNELGDHCLTGNGGVLLIGGVDALLRQPVGTADAAGTQPAGEPHDPETHLGLAFGSRRWPD